MGMPEIKSSTVTRSQAVTDVIQSIALGEAALAHILNAQGEHLQYFIEDKCATKEQLVDILCCVTKTIDSAANLEHELHEKLKTICDGSCKEKVFAKKL